MTTETITTIPTTHSTIEQRARALSSALLDSTIQRVKEAVNTQTLEQFKDDVIYSALNERQQRWVESEFDLKTCPVVVGDVIEVLQENANMATVPLYAATTVLALDGISIRTGPCLMAYTSGRIREEGWYFGRNNFRLVPQPDHQPVPPVEPVFDWSPLWERVRDSVREYDVTCSCTQCTAMRGGPDHLLALVRANNLWPETFSTTGAEKAFAGQMLRWARALVVQRMFGRDSTTLTLGRPVSAYPEPMPERDLTVTPVSPDLVASIEALTVRMDRLSRDNERLTAENRTLREWQTSALADAEKFCDALSVIADRRELCSEFEDAVEKANESTRVLQFESTRNKEVVVVVTGTANINWSVSVTVNRGPGMDDDDVEERAKEIAVNDYGDRQLVRDYGDMYDITIEVDEAELQ